MSLLGEHLCSLDSKGRLRLPALLQQQLGPSLCSQGFVIHRGFEPCLVLYPQTTWERITTQLQTLNLFVEAHRRFVRAFFRGASPLHLDAQQRLLLPKHLMEYAGLDAEALLFAYFDRIEIWQPARYEAQMDLDASDFAALAQNVLGNTTHGTDPTL